MKILLCINVMSYDTIEGYKTQYRQQRVILLCCLQGVVGQ